MKKYKNFLVGLFAIAIIAGSAYNFTLGKQDADRAANHSFSSATLNNIAKAAAEKETNLPPRTCRYVKMGSYSVPVTWANGLGNGWLCLDCCVSGTSSDTCNYDGQSPPNGDVVGGPIGCPNSYNPETCRK